MSIYHIHGDGYDMKIAGELDGDTYYLWAAAGRGIRLAWRELRDAMKLSGLNEMNADTKFKAVARIARSLGGEISAKPDGWEYISLKVV
ncbi:hypothetical protein [Vibrio nigripulchritudo]|uniref:hypothetical protein n=1 Tax=Vibrio nigripulchritudo TaxID=28173 RepID=UPI00249362AA|nr:hypothetical protein [Vibrio nigripulchritudo]